MEVVLYEFPAYAQDIIMRLVRKDWIIHCFDLDNKYDVYNPAGYLKAAEFDGIEYTVRLDLNIYQYVLSAFRKSRKSDLHRDAIAFMVFSRFCNMVVDPTLAIYEKLNYLKQCPDELIHDLILFRRIDNSDMDGLAEFALGYSDVIVLPDLAPVDVEVLKIELTKHKRLKKWDTFYLFMLKMAELYHFDPSPNEEKFRKFLEWCHKDFIYSLVAICFAIRLMGCRSLEKLMKYKPTLTPRERKDALVNMTWDLFLVDKFFEDWVRKEKNREFIYASNDRPLREVLEMAISIQLNAGGGHLVDDLPPYLIKIINEIDIVARKTKGRSAVDATDFKGYRDRLINEVELLVLADEPLNDGLGD